MLQERKLTAAALAETANLQRGRVRQILSGAQPMMVDELLQLSQALQLSPADFGFQADASEDAEAVEAAFEEAEDDDGIPLTLQPLGNQPSQLFQVAFALGSDFLFLAKADELHDSGVPKIILSKYVGKDLPIKLDSAYHQYNNPRYDDHGLTLTLSFDALYECNFPWPSIRQVVFFPATPPPPADDITEDEPPPPPGKPFLRLVE